MSFEEELKHLINKHSIENEWDTPDFLMANLIVRFIKAVGKPMKANLDWHDVDSIYHPSKKEL